MARIFTPIWQPIEMMTDPSCPSSQKAAPESTKFLIALAIIAASAFPLSTLLNGMQDGDGVLTALMSTQKLTWYFWGQDRFLNFIPALSYPISDVIWNLRFQLFLRSFFAFLAPVGFLCFLTRSAKTLTIATVLTNCVLALVLSPEALLNLYVLCNPFGTSLVLLACAYALFARGARTNGPRLALAGMLLFLAYATNFALFIVSLPFLVVVLCFATEDRKRLLVFLSLNALAVALAYGHAKYFGEANTQMGIAPSLLAIRAGYQAVAAQMSRAWVAAFVLIALITSFVMRAPNRWAATLLIAGCMALIGVLSCSVWAQINAYNIRYYLIFIIGIVASSAYLLIACASREGFIGKQYYASVVWALLLIAFIGGLHGFSATPGALIKPTWREQSEAIAEIADREHVELIAGGFWDVWPAVLDANAKLQATGKASVVYGGTQRGHVLRETIWRLSRSRGSLQTLCFFDSVQACADAASNGLKAYIRAVPNSERVLDVNGKAMLLLELRFADQDSPPPPVAKWGQRPLKAEQVHVELLAGQNRFDPANDKIVVPIALHNSGTLTLTPYGDHAVNLGARLTDGAGKVVNLDYAREPLPPSDSGQIAQTELNLPANELDGYGLSILPVQEGVAWFDQFGVAPVVEGPFHRCMKDGRPWMCDTSRALDAK